MLPCVLPSTLPPLTLSTTKNNNLLRDKGFLRHEACFSAQWPSVLAHTSFKELKRRYCTFGQDAPLKNADPAYTDVSGSMRGRFACGRLLLRLAAQDVLCHELANVLVKFMEGLTMPK